MLIALAVLSANIAGIEPDAAAGDRLGYAAKWIALAALPLVLMVAAVGNERFGSEAIDPTAGKESPAMIVNGRVCENTLQQFMLFTVACLALASGLTGDRLGVIFHGTEPKPHWHYG